ncbi:MAG: sugar phosphate isomerase/epimerase family protein [Bacteroidales bacterium]
MNYNRRDFIKASALALGAIGVAGLPVSCGRNRKNGTENIFNYALCNESMQELSWARQCDIIGNAGYKGVEIAPFTLVDKGVEEIGSGERSQMVRDMEASGIRCAGLHWLLAPPPEDLHFTTPDEEVRRRSVDYLDALIDFCGDLGGEVMIFGSPDQRSSTEGIKVAEAKKYFAEGLSSVADHARERDVKILVEPLSSDQTDLVNTLADAMEIVNEVDHPAISTMFDFHNTPDETLPLDELVRKYAGNIGHVHFQAMDGTLMSPADLTPEYVRVFEVLKELDYDQWVSVEVFDFSPGGKTIAEECMKTFREIENRIG